MGDNLDLSQYDFGGYATRNGIRCSDGRTIMKDAFRECDHMTVPLVWMHQHNDPTNVLGHALLLNKEDGVYTYGKFNDTIKGINAKKQVANGDITNLSIYANKLEHNGSNVVHGAIREVSLVLAGANPGAFIDTPVLSHSDGSSAEDEAIIYTDEYIMPIVHSAISEEKEEVIEHADEKASEDNTEKENSKVADNKEKTVKDVFDELTEEQKQVVYFMIGQAIEEAGNTEEEDEEMKHNAFDGEEKNFSDTLSHDDMAQIIATAKREGSFKESFLAHADEYGIQDIEYLFPEAKNLNMPPEFIKRETDWVTKFMNGTKHSPFSRIKSMFADITEDQARAKGYIKGKLKKEEVFSLLKRSTSPTTIYKKQKMDRDDVLDITDFDVIAWLKSEMRGMLDEEVARAGLIGDGRLASDDDKIDPSHIRPILTDADLFVIRWGVAAGASDADKAKNFITAAIKSRKNYKGSGNPTLWTTEDMLTDMLLLEDTQGYKLYKTESELATALRVKEIVTVPVMEGLTVDVSGSAKAVYGIIVNPADYTYGADKGGSVSMFEDFDIDYNQQKYLIETRCSGALTKPFSAIVLRNHTSTESLEPTWADIKSGLNA